MKNLNFALLIDVYESLLTPKQSELMKLYYWEDMSLGEIAEYFSITRQAVRDGIKRGELAISQLEEKLSLAEKITKCRECFDSIIKWTENSSDSKSAIEEIHSLAVTGREMF